MWPRHYRDEGISRRSRAWTPEIAIGEGETIYRWKKRFGDLGTAEVRELRQLRRKNRKFKPERPSHHRSGGLTS
jgi:hypothetical protein